MFSLKVKTNLEKQSILFNSELFLLLLHIINTYNSYYKLPNRISKFSYSGVSRIKRILNKRSEININKHWTDNTLINME